MEDKLYKQITKDREKLLSILSKHSTYEVVGWCANYLNSTDRKEGQLGSPIRQTFYLLGLMLNTEEPKEPIGFGEGEWNNCAKLLNSITTSYIFMYWPSINNNEHISDRWKDIIDVVEPTFLDYFNTGLLATVEQVINRTKKYISPFDDYLKNKLNINSKIAIKLSNYSHITPTLLTKI